MRARPLPGARRHHLPGRQRLARRGHPLELTERFGKLQRRAAIDASGSNPATKRFAISTAHRNDRSTQPPQRFNQRGKLLHAP
jgi:hypothetical protein